ncbi:MAG: heavy metal translocating P-type ATPase [Angelakisella sp.]
MTEHHHEHHEGCNHEHHDSNSHAHCHCSSCTMEQATGGSDHGTCSSSPKGGCSCTGDDGGGGDSEDDPERPHSHCCHNHEHNHEDGDGCGCGHDHEHGEEINGKQIAVLATGTVLFAAALLLKSIPSLLSLILFVAAYLVIGGDVLLRAVKNIMRGQVFDENFLMAIATVGAFAIGEYPEGVAVMLFYQVGELFQSYAVGRSRRSITELMDIRPDYANLVLPDGSAKTVPPDSVSVGAQILIKPGEKIPLDSIVLDGTALIDTAALTGESLPREVAAGSELLSGCINRSGLLRAEVTREFGQSTVSKILELTENASGKKAKAQQFITRFAKVYTPVVVIAAALLAILPPLFVPGALFSDWLYRALVFLVISCPCALVISIPLSFFGGIGGASRCGVLIKGGNYLEALASADIVVFDKTGTLTKGAFQVTEILPQGISQQELLSIAASAEYFSTHPIARSVVSAYSGEVDKSAISDYTELSGRGISATVDGKKVLAGNHKLMEEYGIAVASAPASGTEIQIAADGVYLGRLIISDVLKEDAPAAISALKALGIQKTVMLTGDAQSAAEIAAKAAGVDSFAAQLLPGDKVSHVEALMQERSPKGTLIFVGDGINDAPVLARADVGVAMGGLGSDAAIEAADVVLMTDQPLRLAAGIRIARKTIGIVRQNIVLALGIKLLVMLLGALGYANMWAAVFADVGVSVLAILNAMRALNTKKFL